MGSGWWSQVNTQVFKCLYSLKAEPRLRPISSPDEQPRVRNLNLYVQYIRKVYATWWNQTNRACYSENPSKKCDNYIKDYAPLFTPYSKGNPFGGWIEELRKFYDLTDPSSNVKLNYNSINWSGKLKAAEELARAMNIMRYNALKFHDAVTSGDHEQMTFYEDIVDTLLYNDSEIWEQEKRKYRDNPSNYQNYDVLPSDPKYGKGAKTEFTPSDFGWLLPVLPMPRVTGVPGYHPESDLEAFQESFPANVDDSEKLSELEALFDNATTDGALWGHTNSVFELLDLHLNNNIADINSELSSIAIDDNSADKAVSCFKDMQSDPVIQKLRDYTNQLDQIAGRFSSALGNGKSSSALQKVMCHYRDITKTIDAMMPKLPSSLEALGTLGDVVHLDNFANSAILELTSLLTSFDDGDDLLSSFDAISIPIRMEAPRGKPKYSDETGLEGIDFHNSLEMNLNSSLSNGYDLNQFNSHSYDATHITPSLGSEICQVAKMWFPGNAQRVFV